MAKMSGLGKGLDALFGPAPEEEQMQENDVLKNLKILEVEPNRDQPRKNFDQEALEELAESIKEYGLIQPIVVTQKDGYYSIVAGERRWRACKIAGLKEIPAIVRNFTDSEMMEIALLENLQRENLNSIEEALAYKNLLTNLNLTQEKLAERLGKSRSHITNMIGLLTLPEEVQNLISEKKISMGHARVLSKLEDKHQIKELTDRIISEGLSVRQIEELTSSEKNYERKNKIVRHQEKNNEYVDLEETLKEKLGTKVKIKKNKLEITFTNTNDLNRLLEIMNLDK